MKKGKFISFVCILFATILVLSLVTYAYDDAAAQQYADKYTFSRNLSYRSFTANCTNFVSQCMLAGGVKMDDTWWYKHGEGLDALLNKGDTWSHAWSVANDLKNYVKNDLGAKRLTTKWMKNSGTDPFGKKVYGYIDDGSNITGRGIEIVFYDWEDDGIIDHSAIIVGTNTCKSGTGVDGDFGDLVDCNSTDHYHVMWHLDYFNKHRDTTAIYVFRL